MKKIRLEGLGLDVEVEDNVNYEWCGTQKDVALCAYRLITEFTEKSLKRNQITNIGFQSLCDGYFNNPSLGQENQNILGLSPIEQASSQVAISIIKDSSKYAEAYFCLKMIDYKKRPPVTNIYTFIQDAENPKSNTFYTGCSETRALQEMEKLGVLEKALKRNGNMPNGFGKLSPEIIIAMGGLFAIQQKGLQDIPSVEIGTADNKTFHLDYESFCAGRNFVFE